MTGLDAIRAAVGALSAIYSIPQPASKPAFDEAYAQSTGISCWRFSSLDRQQWFIAVMGEESHRAEIQAVCAAVERHGGTLTGEPQPGMLDSLRERRWQTTLAAVREGRKTVSRRAHYGQAGARLHRDGTMRPGKRPQG